MTTTLAKLPPAGKSKIDPLVLCALRTLLYYDLFSYPLTTAEIQRHSAQPNCSLTEVQDSLDELCRKQIIFHSGGFYSVRNDALLFTRRMKGNQAAKNILPKAQRRSRLIASFPFVRCVCISGSFSKNYFDESTDLDFFVITAPNRLWICRTLLILFKKIFLFDSKKFFCVNYLIDSDNLLIPDHNVFTATEIITLLPMCNYELYRKFFLENKWIRSFFPNAAARPENNTPGIGNSFLKTAIEFLLKERLGEWLDGFLLRKTVNHWKRKFGWQPAGEFELNMRSRRNVSKHHPNGFQYQVLKRYNENISAFQKRHQINLSEP